MYLRTLLLLGGTAERATKCVVPDLSFPCVVRYSSQGVLLTTKSKSTRFIVDPKILAMRYARLFTATRYNSRLSLSRGYLAS